MKFLYCRGVGIATFVVNPLGGLNVYLLATKLTATMYMLDTHGRLFSRVTTQGHGLVTEV